MDVLSMPVLKSFLEGLPRQDPDELAELLDETPHPETLDGRSDCNGLWALMNPREIGCGHGGETPG